MWLFSKILSLGCPEIHVCTCYYACFTFKTIPLSKQILNRVLEMWLGSPDLCFLPSICMLFLLKHKQPHRVDYLTDNGFAYREPWFGSPATSICFLRPTGSGTPLLPFLCLGRIKGGPGKWPPILNKADSQLYSALTHCTSLLRLLDSENYTLLVFLPFPILSFYTRGSSAI